MTGSTQVLPVTADDAPRLALIHASSFSDHWPAASIDALLSRPQVAAIGGMIDGARELQAFVLIQIIADEAEILTFCVMPDLRRQGLGRDLLQSAVDLAKARGASRMFLEVGEDNLAARTLYGRAGFALVGRRVAYYHGAQADQVGADALVLRKMLA